jgi:hypothetical protein
MARILSLEQLALCLAPDAGLMLDGLNDVNPFVDHPLCGAQPFVVIAQGSSADFAPRENTGHA